MPRLVALVLFVALPALAYEARLHDAITRTALPASLREERAAPVSRAHLDGFRRWFYTEVVTSLPEPARARFLARWPTGQAFTSGAFRELLGLSGAARLRVLGIEIPFPSVATAADVLAAGAAAVETDQRHRDATLSSGGSSPVPRDPAVLAFGPASGASSDGWAFTAAVVPAEASPRGVAGEGQGPAFASTFQRLALVASRWTHPSARTIALGYLGNSAHYVQKLASPLWATPLGHPEFLEAATSQYRWRAVLTAGGTIGPLRPPGISAEALQRNHRRFTDRRTAERLDKAPPPPLATPVEPATAVVPLAQRVHAEAAAESESVYALAIRATCDRMRLEGFVFHDPRAEVASASNSVLCESDSVDTIDALTQLDGLIDRSLVRATAATASLVAGFAGAQCDSGCLAGLIAERLDALDAADQRREALLRAGVPQETTRSTVWTVGVGAAAFGLLFGVWFWARRTPSLNIDYWARPTGAEEAPSPPAP